MGLLKLAERRTDGADPVGQILKRVFLWAVPALALSGCAYSSNVANDLAYMGDPTYDACRRNADATSNYGARCAREADPKVKAAKSELAQQASEQQRRAAAAAQQRAETQQNSEVARGYSRIEVRDFTLDGRELANRSAKVSLVGVYMPAGNLELLFGAQLDAIKFGNGDGETVPAVHLMMADAARDFRSEILSCRSNYSSARIGCPARILGVATMCTLTNAFGNQQQVPCIAVAEGSIGRH